jgi:polyisoprenoid-binding protein YceI
MADRNTHRELQVIMATSSPGCPYPMPIALRRMLAALASLAVLPTAAAEYAIDPAHTYASFEIDHLGFSTQRGLFNRTSGTLRFDPEAATGEVDIRIAAASIDTGFAQRDDVLRGPDWFDVQNHPDILFRSRQMVFEEGRLVAVDGTLALLGTIRPVRLEVQRLKCGLNLAIRKRGCGADATTSFRRSDFGLSNGIPFVGDEVRLRIQIEAYQP